MNNIDHKIKQLYILSLRGVGGEAVAAKKGLDRLLKKYNMTIDSVISEEPKERELPTRTKVECQLCSQIVYAVLGKSGKSYGYKGSMGTYSKLTDAQYVEVSELLSFHKKHIKKEAKVLMEKFRLAYYQKHRLFPTCDADEAPNQKKLSLDEQMEIMAMANNMSDEKYQKKLTQTSHDWDKG